MTSIWIEIGGRPATRAKYNGIVEARKASIRKLDGEDPVITVAALYPNKDCKGDECLGVVVKHLGGVYTWNRKTRKGIVEQRLLKNGQIKRDS